MNLFLITGYTELINNLNQKKEQVMPNTNLNLAKKFLEKDAEYSYRIVEKINEEKTTEKFRKAFAELMIGRVDFLEKDECFCWKDFKLFFDIFCKKYEITDVNCRRIKKLFLTLNDFKNREHAEEFELYPKIGHGIYHPFWNSNLIVIDKFEQISFVRQI